MFFQGTLQEGIAAALSQSKLVLCFVTGRSFAPGHTSIRVHH
jgi:hypothetical protein